MSTIKSSDEHLTLNADGSSKDIKFQANGVEKASIDSSGNLTVSGNLTSVGIDDNADATAITIDSSERVGIGTTSMEANLHIKKGDSGASVHPSTALYIENNGDTILQIGSPNNAEGRIFFTDPEDSNIGQISYGHSDNHMRFRTNDSEQLRITSDGRGLSQFTAKAWVAWNQTGTIAIRDSHNVSSMSDYGTGEAKINLTNNMATADSYAVSALAAKGSGAPSGSNSTFTTIGESSPVTGPIIGMIYNGSASDRPYASAIIFGD